MGEASAFFIGETGVETGRVDPSAFNAPEGSSVFILGTQTKGWKQTFVIGDELEVAQTDTPPGGSKVVRFKARLRGPDSMPLLSGLENFALADAQTLIFSVDGGANQTVTLATADFAAIGAARAFELAGVINRDLNGATARLSGDGSLTVLSDSIGRRSRVQIIGGTAAAAVAFDELVWIASAEIAGTEVFTTRILPGDERDLSDFGAATPGFGAGPYEIKFTLKVGTR